MAKCARMGESFVSLLMVVCGRAGHARIAQHVSYRFCTMDAAITSVSVPAVWQVPAGEPGPRRERSLMLVTTKEMLLDAQKNHYAVGAFNVENLEFVMAVLAAAEETKSPVIMQTTSGTIKKTGLDYFYGMVKAAAERASVPVALHLDHGDGYDRCMKALRTGYTSVMIDGSHESFEDNIALTKSVADAGAAMGIPVEAELGKVGGKEDDVEVEGESPYTDPVEAKEFVERTGCTSLAIGVATSTRTSSRPSAPPSTCRWSFTAPPACRTSRSPRLSRTASAR